MMHTKGSYDVKDDMIISKPTNHFMDKPAILMDFKYGCVHRIDDSDNLRRDYAKLVNQLSVVGSKYTEHLILIEYDTKQEKVIWNFNNSLSVEIDDACTIMNFITNGGDIHMIQKVLNPKPNSISKYAKVLQEMGF